MFYHQISESPLKTSCWFFLKKFWIHSLLLPTSISNVKCWLSPSYIHSGYTKTCAVNSRNLAPELPFLPLPEALGIRCFSSMHCLKTWYLFPIGTVLAFAAAAKGNTQVSWWASWWTGSGAQAELKGAPRQRPQGRLHALRDLVESFPTLNILSLHSSFPAWPNTSWNLPDSFQLFFIIAHSSLLHIIHSSLFFNSTPGLLPQIRTLFPRRGEKKLILPSCWGKQNLIFSHSAERSFVLALKLKIIDLDLE